MDYTRLAFIIPLLIILTSSSGFARTSICKWHHINGNATIEPYDTASEICCPLSGKHKKTNRHGNTIDCCEDTTIDTDSQVCCNNQTYDSPIRHGLNAGKRRICCGSTLHVQHEQSHYCCGTAFISQNLQCCAGKPYNRSKSICEQNTGTVLAIGEGICGSKVYNVRQQKCCGYSTLYNISEANKQYQCCDSSLYNINRSQCCTFRSNKIVQNLSGQCCGTGLYSTKTEICCQGNRFTSFGVLGCCGGGTYNTTDPKVGCCLKRSSWKAYSKDQEICCEGAVHSVATSAATGNLSCCGNQSYSPRQKLCCGHKTKFLINKTALDHDLCCSSGPTAQYSSCKKSQQPAEKLSMCGMVPYNQSTDLCCNNEIHKDEKTLGKKCCQSSTTTYFPNNEICCFNQVKPKASGCFGSPRTSGICKICSPEWKQPRMIESLVQSKTIDICTKKALKLKVNSVSPKNTTSEFPWTWLNVTYKQNIYKKDCKTSTIHRNQSFGLLLPCRCPRLDNLQGRPALLLTRIDFNIQKIFLGDGDLLLPLRNNLVTRILKLSTVCPNDVVKYIYSRLQISPNESPNCK